MKKLNCFLFVTVWAFLGNQYSATAQCTDGGSWFNCYSVSHNQTITTNGQDWYADGTLYYVTVSMKAYSNNNSYSYAEVTTSDSYWYNMITTGTYQDDFYATGQIGQLLRLYTAARNGEADLSASW